MSIFSGLFWFQYFEKWNFEHTWQTKNRPGRFKVSDAAKLDFRRILCWRKKQNFSTLMHLFLKTQTDKCCWKTDSGTHIKSTIILQSSNISSFPLITWLGCKPPITVKKVFLFFQFPDKTAFLFFFTLHPSQWLPRSIDICRNESSIERSNRTSRKSTRIRRNTTTKWAVFASMDRNTNRRSNISCVHRRSGVFINFHFFQVQRCE